MIEMELILYNCYDTIYHAKYHSLQHNRFTAAQELNRRIVSSRVKSSRALAFKTNCSVARPLHYMIYLGLIATPLASVQYYYL